MTADELDGLNEKNCKRAGNWWLLDFLSINLLSNTIRIINHPDKLDFEIPKDLTIDQLVGLNDSLRLLHPKGGIYG